MNFTQKIVIGVLASVGFLTMGYLTGRYTTPAEIQTIEKEKIVEVVDKESIRVAVEKRETELRAEFKKKEEASTCKVTIVNKKTKPDGTVEETSVTQESTNNSSQTDQSTSVVDKQEDVQIEVEKEVVYKTIEKDKIVIQKSYASYGLGFSVDFDVETFDIEKYNLNFEKSIFSGMWLTMNLEADKSFYVDFKPEDFSIGIGLKISW